MLIYFHHKGRSEATRRSQSGLVVKVGKCVGWAGKASHNGGEAEYARLNLLFESTS